jgi:hypothetical protein
MLGQAIAACIFLSTVTAVPSVVLVSLPYPRPLCTPLTALSQLLVDDLGQSDVSFNARLRNNGFAAIDTPELDELAEGSTGIHLINGEGTLQCRTSDDSADIQFFVLQHIRT